MSSSPGRGGTRAGTWAILGTALALLAAPASLARAESPVAVDQPGLHAIAEAWRVQAQAPGVVVGIQIGDGPPLFVATGTVSDGSAALTVDATFEIASITKTFTGRLVLDLADAGVLGLDDTLDRWLPDFPRADAITICQLLTHTSGIPPEWNENGPTPWSDDMLQLVISDLTHTFTPEEVIGIVRDRVLLFEPGTGVQYSNVNAIPLGEVVAAATGTDYATALHDRLLTPLALDHTSFRAVDDGVHATGGVGQLPDGTVYDTGTMPDRALLSFMGPAGAMVSTPADLLEWGVDDFRAGVVDAADLAGSRFEVMPDGTALGVVPWSSLSGFCLFGGCTGPVMFDAIAGVGLSPGTSSMVVYLPRLDATIVAFSNSSATEVDSLVHDIVTALAPETK
ncbi:MAG: beta-lactamase family protein [Chloroflexi bacterium]|nr:beta-lactamase family protein [Chloroflexota bacterium]